MTHQQPLLDHNGDRRPLQLAILSAILVHLIALYITLPQTSRVILSDPQVSLPLVPFHLPPPPLPKPPEKLPQHPLEQRMLLIPIPDPTPDEIEPIREPEPDPDLEPLPPDMIAFPVVTGPPPVGRLEPQLPGVNGVTDPVRIHFVEPQFPALARRAGILGRVLLQAVVSQDGRIKNLTVLTSSTPGLGFEQAAMDAVKQWKYKPAEQDEKPVTVYLTIVIDFTLH
jgi:protein TonB